MLGSTINPAYQVKGVMFRLVQLVLPLAITRNQDGKC